MKFSDCLTSVMNGVRVRRKLWGKNAYIQVSIEDERGAEAPAFTVEDAQADDWQIVVPRPGKDERVK